MKNKKTVAGRRFFRIMFSGVWVLDQVQWNPKILIKTDSGIHTEISAAVFAV